MTITPKKLFFILAALALSFAATNHIMLQNQASDARIIRAEDYVGRFKEADDFIKETFPLGSSLWLFKSVMSQSGFREGFDAGALGYRALPLKSKDAVGVISYEGFASCPGDHSLIPILCSVFFIAEYDTKGRIVRIYTQFSSYDF